MSAPVVQVDLRGVPAGELVAALRAAYLRLPAGQRLRALVAHDPRRAYMAFVEMGIAHRTARLDAGTWEWTATRTTWEPMSNGPGVHHVGISPDGRRVYAVDRDRTAYMVDVSAGRLAGRVSVGAGTSHLAVHPRTGGVYVAEARTRSMVRLDGASLAPTERIATASSPGMPVAAADGSVVLLPGSDGSITLTYEDADVSSLTMPVGGRPSASTIGPDGARAYLPDTTRNLLVTVDLHERRVLAETPVGDGPSHPAVTPDGSLICVANSRSHDISLVDAASLQAIATIPSGEAAHQTSITPDGRTLVVANFFENSVTIVDLPSRTRVAVVPVGPYPHGLDVDPSGRYAVATHFGDDWCSVVDLAGRRVAARVRAGLGSAHTAFSPDGSRAYIANGLANTVTEVDLANLEATAQIPVD